MSKHRIRHENAYRAGARAGVLALLEALIAVTPEAAHAALRRLAERVAGQFAFQRIEGKDRDPQ
ncbi:hypothetical protein [Paracoccus sp. N5]|uniref:hypothetical protein n=1 Tax=Paracoccus sp. N5 TaxID=1101189 RepID=UPI0012F8203D|nr:hypothetical protein [Paracoccus sp. N5]